MAAPVRLLIANRGEIARRIMRTARQMGLRTVAVFAASDAGAPFVREADEAVALAGITAAETYLDVPQLLAAAKRTGADAVHPGYGFLSENPEFAAAVTTAGLTWVGPAAETIAAMGDKLRAKRLMAAAGVPVLPALPVEGLSSRDLVDRVDALGYPVLVKAAAGGGGRGMRVVADRAMLDGAIASAAREATSAFGDGRLFIERYVGSPRHVEVQILGDHDGHVLHCFERECSIQRRHQKIVEETPSPALSDALRSRITAVAVAAARAIGYVSAGTVEFIVDAESRFYFLEVNTRLQVEHAVTEAITGLDLVREQLRVAGGECLDRTQAEVVARGHAIEVRLYAEDAANDFLPASGRVLRWEEPAGMAVRVDAGVTTGTDVPAHFDPLLAKLIAHAPTRSEAAARLARALELLRVHGITTNREFLVSVLRHPAFLAGDTTTDFIARHRPLSRRVPSDTEQRLAALATALFDRARRTTARRVLPTIPSGYRNNPTTPQRVRYRAGEREHEVSYRQERSGVFAYDIDGTRGTAAVSGLCGDRIALEVDGVRTELAVMADGVRRFVQTPSGEIQFVEIDRFPRPERTPIPGAHVAPTPGRVVDVSVAAGDTVTAGQRLVVLEAMKMEHQIVAASSGRVVEVRVVVGAQVQANDLLVVLDGGEGEQ
jgi:propionyl-CoA carboxylase alpha chain